MDLRYTMELLLKNADSFVKHHRDRREESMIDKLFIKKGAGI